jgi:ribose transport system ATP-binding protein
VVETRPVAGLDAQALAELMVGADVDAGYRAGLTAPPDRAVVLRARNLRGRFLNGVDIELREGEVLGVAGLPGSGRDELPYALAGSLAGATGEIHLAGQGWQPVRKSMA